MKALFKITWSLLLLPLCSFGQNEERIDSLLQELEAATDQEQVIQLSSQLWSENINSDANEALIHAERIISIGEALNQDSIRSNGYHKKGVGYAYLNEFDSSGFYFRRALVLFEKAEDYDGMASTQRNLGQDFNMVGELDSASYYYEQAGENFARINDSVGMADISNSEAIVYYIKGFYNLAFNKAVASEAIFKQQEDLAIDLNQNRLVIASIYSAMKDTLNAIEYFNEAINYFQANNMPRQFASTGVLLVELLIPKHEAYPEVANLIEDMLAACEDLQDPSLTNHVRLTKAALAYEKENYGEALRIQSDLVDNTQQEGQEYLQAINALALGKTLSSMGEHVQAIVHLKRSDALLNQLGLEANSRDAKELLAHAYEATGDYRNSLAYFRAYKSLDEEIYTEERTKRFDELQTIYEIEKKENALALQAEEIKTLNAQAKANRLTSTLYGTGMLSFILISGLLYFSFRQRMKKNEIEREKQEAIFRQELDFKKKELTSQTLHLVQKSTLIQDVKVNLERIKREPELFKTESRKLIAQLSRQSSEDENWEVFKSYFSQVHNDFDQELRQQSEDITENDVRLASFLRMNLTTKEIASLLNVLPDSVIKSKYRLKKKLNLPKEQELGAYLNTL